MVRLSEEIIQTSQQTKEKQSCLETVRTAREEMTATVQANIEACMDAFVLVFTVHTAVVEHHTDMNDAQRVTTRTRTSWSRAGDETGRPWLTGDERCAGHWECTDRLNQHWGLRRRWNTQDVTQDGVHAEVRPGTGWHISLQRDRTKKGPDHPGAGVAVKRQEQLGVSSQGAKDLPQGLAERRTREQRPDAALDVLAAGDSTSTGGGAQDSTTETGSTRHADRSINSSMSASRSARWPRGTQPQRRQLRRVATTELRRECTLEAEAGESRTTARRSEGSCGNEYRQSETNEARLHPYSGWLHEQDNECPRLTIAFTLRWTHWGAQRERTGEVSDVE